MQIQGLGRFGARDGLVLAGLLVGLGSVAYGLIRSPLLESTPIPGTWLTNLWLTAAGAAVVTAACRHLLPRHFHAALALFYVALLLLTFGPVPVAAVALLSCVALAIGSSIIRGGNAETLLLKTITGWAIILLVLNILIYLPVHSGLTHAAAALALIVIFRRGLIAAGHEIVGMLRVSREPPSLETTLIAAGALFIFAWHAVGAALPERSFDPLLMHLYAPAVVETFGFWNVSPADTVFAVMPMAIDWAFTTAYLMAGEYGSRLVNLSFLFIIAGQLYLILRGLIRPTQAGWLTLVFAASPIAFFETTALMIEHGLMMLMLGAFAALLASEKSQHGAFAACCLCLAAAISAKLHGLVIAALIGALLLPQLFSVSQTRRQVTGRIVLVLVAILLAATPYLVAFVRTGNPVLPFFNAIFQSPYYPPENMADARWIPILSWDMLYRLTFHSDRYFEGWPGAFGFQFLLLLAAAIIAAILKPRREILYALFVSGLFASIIISQVAYLRYIYPVFPIGTIALAAVFTATPFVQACAKTLAIGCIGLNLVFLNAASHTLRDADWRTALSEQRKQELLKTAAASRLIVQRLNASNFPQPRVLFLKTEPGPLVGTAIFATWHAPLVLAKLNRARTPDAVLALLREKRITHILLAAKPNFPRPALDAIAAYGTVVDSEGTALLVRLRDEVWADNVALTSNPQGNSREITSPFQVEPSLQPRFFRAHATLHCNEALDTLYLQITWNSPEGFLGSKRKTFVCPGKGSHPVVANFISPKGTNAGAIYAITVDSSGASTITVDSLWRGHAVVGSGVW